MKNSQRVLQSFDDIKKLAEVLGSCPQVTRYDTAEEKEAWTLAHAFSDIEESMQKIYADHLPALLAERPTPSDIYDRLLAIGEELRHVLYHIHDPKFYDHLAIDGSRESS